MGRQFERLVGVMKQAVYKSIGHGNLCWKELEEVLLDVETTINNRPLFYVEDANINTKFYAVWAVKPNSGRRSQRN